MKKYRSIFLVLIVLLIGCITPAPDNTPAPGEGSATEVSGVPSDVPNDTPAGDATPEPVATSEPVTSFGPTFTPAPVTPNLDHPRLWLTAKDVPRLRAWAVDSNPLYAEGLALVAASAKEDMDAGYVPDTDCGDVGWEEYPTEMYAEFFAFMSLVENDEAARADYAERAHTLLMHIINAAAQGPASEPNVLCNDYEQYPAFRHPDFATEDRDRARYHGEALPLAVDWIYPTLTPEDKAAIRTVFLRWSQEIVERGYHHPEPIGMVYSPDLLFDLQQVRFSGNNYYAAHMRNMGLMALALDDADDPDGQLRAYLDNAVGARLFILDHLLRTDSAGGLLPEGFEYSPQTAGYITQFFLALHTAGQDSTPLTQLNTQPFWDDFVTAYLHSLSPATTTLENAPELGQVYQPVWYGDAQVYRLPDFIDAFAPLGVLDAGSNNLSRLNAVRWIVLNTAPGGEARLLERAGHPDDLRHAIFYFMLFDPTAPAPTDPRPSLPLDFLAPGMNRAFSRSSWDPQAAWFNFSLSWNSIDHQMADGNQFGFYRAGEWLTKGRTGYADIAEGIASSEFYNTLGLENTRPLDRDDTDWRIDLWRRGSQWNYVSVDNPTLLQWGATETYFYALGDATNLYNSLSEGTTDVVHASRSILWLKPDVIVIYDRAESLSEGQFKRWWLQVPAPAVVEGNHATITTERGQQLFVTALLPANVTLQFVPVADDQAENTAAQEEPMTARLFTEAPGDPLSTRFLHVLEGADGGVTASEAVWVQSDDGTFEGAVIGQTVVLFPVSLGGQTDTLSYLVSGEVQLHLITGLTPGSTFDVVRTVSGDSVQITIQPGSTYEVSAGGVLEFTTEP